MNVDPSCLGLGRNAAGFGARRGLALSAALAMAVVAPVALQAQSEVAADPEKKPKPAATAAAEAGDAKKADAAGAGDKEKGNGQSEGDAKATEAPAKGGSDKDNKDKDKVTRHSVTVNGKRLEYEAKAGTLSLKDATGKVTADIFYVAYTLKGPGAQDKAKRPLTFSFNGGPGSSSVWMHMGLLGPKRVKLRDDGFAVPPPYELVENEFSLLDETDLVFIDPVGTGYSRAAKPEEAKTSTG